MRTLELLLEIVAFIALVIATIFLLNNDLPRAGLALLATVITKLYANK